MSEAKETDAGGNGASSRAIAESVERGDGFKAHIIGRDRVHTSAAVKPGLNRSTNAESSLPGKDLRDCSMKAVLPRPTRSSHTARPTSDSKGNVSKAIRS